MSRPMAEWASAFTAPLVQWYGMVGQTRKIPLAQLNRGRPEDTLGRIGRSPQVEDLDDLTGELGGSHTVRNS